MGNLCCAREHSVQFFRAVFYTVKLHSLTYSVWGPLECMGPFRVYGALIATTPLPKLGNENRTKAKTVTSKYFNPLTPVLNPSTQRCLPRFFTGDFNF
jgi:hypothetical protein